MSCEMEELNPIKIFKCDHHATYVTNQVHRLYKDEKLFDIKIIAGVDKVAVGAHQVVLSASSDYFRAKFLSVFKEARLVSIELSDVDGQSLEAVLDFMYSASIELHSETVKNVLKIAELFQLSTLTAGCCDFLESRLDHTNCIGTAEIAKRHNYLSLHEKSLSYAFKNFEKVFENEEFLKLDVTKLTELFEHNLQTIPPEQLFLGLVAWFNHDETAREEFMHRLLSDYINFESLDPKFINKNRKSICKNFDCYELICSWLGWHLEDEKEGGKIIYASCTDSGLSVRSYCPRCNKWTLEDWPQPKQWRTNYSAVITNKKFILAGGEVGGVETNTVECLDTQTMVWSDLPSMSVARSASGMAELNGNLYVVGGSGQAGVVSTVEKYDFENFKMWENVPNLPSALDCPRAVVLRGKLYVLGDGELSLVCYDPTTKEWTQTASKTEKSSEFGLVVIKGHLYVIGGKLQSGEISKTVERYNPLSNTWTVEESMAQACRYPACCAWNNRIFACGGAGKDKWFNTHFEYDCRTKIWKSLAKCDVPDKTPKIVHIFSEFLSTLETTKHF